jgi:histidine phosphotransferase ChpT
MTAPSPSGEDAAAPSAEAGALAALIGSRICHDLVNPVGAIANGVELLQMAGAVPGSDELTLVAQAVAHAAARLRLYRVAYGVAAPGQSLARSETALILAEALAGGRLAVDWRVAEDRPRAEVKLAFLILQCVEAALPRGGDVHVGLAEDRWRIEARAERLRIEPALWALLDGAPLPEALRPGEVQFALAPRAAAAIGRRIAAETGATSITVVF